MEGRKKYKLIIAGIKIAINMPENLELPNVGFHFEENFQDGKEDVKYEIKCESHIENPPGTLLRSIGECELYHCDHKYVYMYTFQIPGKKEMARLELSHDQTDNVLYIPQEYAQECMRYLFSMLGMELILLRHNRICMHGALVRYQGEGMIFTGPSGIGKSTQSNLWEKYEHAEILNGDRVIIQEDEQMIGHGSPYAGSSGIYRKEQAPIKAIIMLKQAKENHIERLTGIQAFKTLFPRFLVFSVDEYTETLYNMIQRIVEEVPIYLLSCRPDQEAVELVKETVFGHNCEKV